MCEYKLELHKCPTCGAECEEIVFDGGEEERYAIRKPVGIVKICPSCNSPITEFEGMLQCKCKLWSLFGTEMA